jgi:hypothetical protein
LRGIPTTIRKRTSHQRPQPTSARSKKQDEGQFCGRRGLASSFEPAWPMKGSAHTNTCDWEMSGRGRTYDPTRASNVHDMGNTKEKKTRKERRKERGRERTDLLLAFLIDFTCGILPFPFPSLSAFNPLLFLPFPSHALSHTLTHTHTPIPMFPLSLPLQKTKQTHTQPPPHTPLSIITPPPPPAAGAGSRAAHAASDGAARPGPPFAAALPLPPLLLLLLLLLLSQSSLSRAHRRRGGKRRAAAVPALLMLIPPGLLLLMLLLLPLMVVVMVVPMKTMRRARPPARAVTAPGPPVCRCGCCRRGVAIFVFRHVWYFQWLCVILFLGVCEGGLLSRGSLGSSHLYEPVIGLPLFPLLSLPPPPNSTALPLPLPKQQATATGCSPIPTQGGGEGVCEVTTEGAGVRVVVGQDEAEGAGLLGLVELFGGRWLVGLCMYVQICIKERERRTVQAAAGGDMCGRACSTCFMFCFVSFRFVFV